MQSQILKQIALYGGSFDPPHQGHLAILSNLITINFINQVWLLPCGDRTDKKLLLTKDERFEILGKQLQRMDIKDKVKLSDYQIKLSKQKKRMIPTIQLLNQLEAEFKQCQFYFVIGTDLLRTIHTWENYKQLLQEKKFIIYPRLGYEMNMEQCLKSNDEKLKSNCSLLKSFHFNNFFPPEISSSSIKKKLQDQNLTKQQKYQQVKQYESDIVIQALKKKNIL